MTNDKRRVGAGLLVLGVCGALAGCAGTLVNSGGFQVSQKWLTEYANTVKPRAAFDLSCPAEQIQLVVVAVDPQNKTDPMQLGASGCDHKGVYVHHFNSWLLNSASTPEQKPTP